MKLFISSLSHGWNIYKSFQWYKKSHESGGHRSTPKATNYAISLAEKLFTIGGSSVLVLKEERQRIKSILKHGRKFRNFTVSAKRMELHECHSEVLEIWKAHPKKLHVVTGFALVDDYWFSHSWCVNLSKSKIIDPTGKCDEYFGVVISHEYTPEYIKLVESWQ